MKTVNLENIKVKDNGDRTTVRKVRRDTEFTSAGLKIGLCIALCIALCIVNLTIDHGTNTVYTGSDGESEGKLRFVELPGIIEVFAGGDKLTMPIGEYMSAQIDENMLVRFQCRSNATVVTCSSGTVKATGEDEKLGNYVVILHGDIETYYYGFGYVTVEERQIINSLDTLGLLSHEGVLYFKICRDGIAQNPTDYLPIKLG